MARSEHISFAAAPAVKTAARPAARLAAALAAVLAVLTVSGCRWSIEREYDPETALAFLPSVGKPGGESQSVPREGSFGLSLWLYSLDTPSEAAEQIAFMSPLEWDGDKWGLPSEPLWPPRRHGLHVLAYSPCEATSACNLTDGVVFGEYDATADPTLDLLYTERISAESKTANGGVISLPFHHALTEISFRFIPYNPAISIRVREVRIPSVFVRGTFRSMPAPAWEFMGETAALVYGYETPFLGSTPTPIPSIFLPPQKLSEGFIIGLSYVDPLGVEREMLVQTEAINKKLLGDRQYIFTVSVNPDAAKVIETSIMNQYESQ